MVVVVVVRKRGGACSRKQKEAISTFDAESHRSPPDGGGGSRGTRAPIAGGHREQRLIGAAARKRPAVGQHRFVEEATCSGVGEHAQISRGHRSSSLQLLTQALTFS